ncbi:MAG: ATP-binding protein [Verrucomicrobia bacterium]|nr:ATP-binding protein [Verrucomicrobiota bacterium]MCH8510357.1 DUF87 domain-containing protein [Kiritimatiellia bacterium]
MKYFAHTLRDHLKRLIERYSSQAVSETAQGRKMLFMVPAMPEATLLDVADAVDSYCLAQEKIHLTLKIAANVTSEWTDSGKFKIQEKGWKEERGNLTFYRSMENPEPSKIHVVVLMGVDRVTDGASLADFHTCDPEMLWRIDMGETFNVWLVEKLNSSGFHDYTDEDLKTMNRIIKPLYVCGKGDLIQISDWLDGLDLNLADDVNEIPKLMLRQLAVFGVPVLSRFPLKQKRKKLDPYITASADFFNYTMFFETQKREKAMSTIARLLEEIDSGNEPNLPLNEEDVHGVYSSGDAMLQGLKTFIDHDDAKERDRLMKCDFVVIWDQILKFKFKESKKNKDTVFKLSGSPFEVLLTAAWMTLKDFYAANKEKSGLNLQSISFQTHQFKHDIESGDTKEEQAEEARRYLRSLIGGIDKIIIDHIELLNINGSEINVKSQLLNEEFSCGYAKTAEPTLIYIIQLEHDAGTFERKFGWRLPEHHMYRLSLDLLKQAKIGMERLHDTYKLPVFHIPYYEEVLQATADEEIRRVLLHAIRDEHDHHRGITNLLGGDWSTIQDPIQADLRQLALKYSTFLQAATTNGIFETIFGTLSVWTDLRTAYAKVFETTAALEEIDQSSMAAMLVRVFLIIGTRPVSLGDSWYADIHEPSGVATLLHPSVIEMLEAQVVYLCRCFNYAVNQELEQKPSKESFRTHVWRTYVDLSAIQTPLTGLLYNEEKNLTANVRGQDLIHRIGISSEADTPLSTRLLIKYNDSHEENDTFSDTEMFRETSESKLLLRLMQDYFDLHPHARDGLNIAVFRNKDIQPVIAAVHAYLKLLAKKPTAQQPNKRYVLGGDRKRPYAISVTLFTESNDETDVASWVEEWKDRWEASETEIKYDLYRRCRFSIAHRIVEKNGIKSFEQLIHEYFEADMAVFYNFIGASEGVNKFEKVQAFDVTDRELKFPILEKACCSVHNPGEKFRRKRIVSNRQFALSAYHSNLLHNLQTGNRQTGTVVVGSGDFTHWKNLIDRIHEKAEWIVCIDPNIDERLIKEPNQTNNRKREIIGFGSGVGSHGEDNYTVSTEQFSLSDIHSRIRASIHQLYGPGAGWNVEDCDRVAKGILHLAPELSGLALVRATGVGDEYIRDFMAYALTRKLLYTTNSLLCESLVSLDAYRHWFDLSDNARRPDLMWMRVSLKDDNRLHIQIKLIECKLGQDSKQHVTKAKSQIDNGLKVLSSAFAPANHQRSAEALINDRPDRRYWWMQLHRLVASKTEVSTQQYPTTLTALERLAEGDYDISWSASVFAFWLNDDDEMKRIQFWNTGEAKSVTANVYAIGGGFVLRLMTENQTSLIDWSEFNNQGSEILEDEDAMIAPAFEDDDSPWEEDDEEDDDELNEDEPATITPFPLPSQKQDALELREKCDQDAPTANTNNSNQFVSESQLPPFPPDDPPPSSDQEIVIVPESNKSFDRVLLGKTVHGDQPVYWEFNHPELANRHMLIFGSSGQGKTYAIQSILCELSRFSQNSLIIDYTNGFLPTQLEKIARSALDPKQHVVRNEPLPINPFLPQVSYDGTIEFKDNSNDVAKRVAGLFDSVYGIGNQQYSVLHRAIMEGVDTLMNGMNLEHMLSFIDAMADDKRYKTYAQSLYNKLHPFVLDHPFASGDDSFEWDHLFLKQAPLCNIFQLAGMDMYSCRLITEFILWDLYGHLQSKGKKTDPKVIVLDEVQNLDHKEGSPLSKYLREGRKFGVSLILATQTMSNMKRDERDRMFNAEHKLFFRPTDTELKSFAEIAALAARQRQSVDEWIRKLSNLSPGECYSIGRILDPSGEHLVPRTLKIRITALEDRSLHV